MKTGCTAPDGSVKAIGDVIYEELGEKYIIASRILNFKIMVPIHLEHVLLL